MEAWVLIEPWTYQKYALVSRLQEVVYSPISWQDVLSVHLRALVYCPISPVPFLLLYTYCIGSKGIIWHIIPDVCSLCTDKHSFFLYVLFWSCEVLVKWMCKWFLMFCFSLTCKDGSEHSYYSQYERFSDPAPMLQTATFPWALKMHFLWILLNKQLLKLFFCWECGDSLLLESRHSSFHGLLQQQSFGVFIFTSTCLTLLAGMNNYAMSVSMKWPVVIHSCCCSFYK